MILLEAGIDVLTTMNVQHLESLNDQMRQITGIQVRETIPDWVVQAGRRGGDGRSHPASAAEPAPRGVVYGPEKAERAMENFFKEPTLAALRELALRQTAHEVDLRQNNILPSTLPIGPAAARGGLATAATEQRERILIHVTEAPATAGLIRRGRRVADYLKADCFAVCVLPAGELTDLPQAIGEAIKQQLDFARKLHIETRVLEGEDAADALVDFARRNGVTQIFLARPPRRSFPLLRSKHTAMKIVDLAKDMQVTVVAERRYAPSPA